MKVAKDIKLIQDTQQSLALVKVCGTLKYQQDFGKQFCGDFPYWTNILELSDQDKGLFAEKAANIFFRNQGYRRLENYYKYRKNLLSEGKINDDMVRGEPRCTSKKGPDNGIDGIFLKSENKEMIINESKFRSGKEFLSKYDFGTVKINDKIVRQSHSEWNKFHLEKIGCLPKNKYKKYTIRRTATLINKYGNLILYDIEDA